MGDIWGQNGAFFNSKRNRLVLPAGKPAVVREAAALGQGACLVELLPDTARPVRVRAPRQTHPISAAISSSAGDGYISPHGLFRPLVLISIAMS